MLEPPPGFELGILLRVAFARDSRRPLECLVHWEPAFAVLVIIAEGDACPIQRPAEIAAPAALAGGFVQIAGIEKNRTLLGERQLNLKILPVVAVGISEALVHRGRHL